MRSGLAKNPLLDKACAPRDIDDDGQRYAPIGPETGICDAHVRIPIPAILESFHALLAKIINNGTHTSSLRACRRRSAVRPAQNAISMPYS